ncbi:MAG TPA: hypothetical protein VJV78_21380, partial [Polyangiales bacterium]|nr:hypothetical protein [Polyangiales bacterium]
MDGQKGYAVSPALFSCLVLLAVVGCGGNSESMSPIGSTAGTAGGSMPAAGSGTAAGSTAGPAGSSAAGSSA